MKYSLRERQWTLAAVIVVLFLAAFLYIDRSAFLFAQSQAEDVQERIMMALAPTPERAFAYGERHFDPSNPDGYDIALAQHYFEYAAQTDPSLPYLYHQLARISFLEGNFPLALAQINFQIEMHGDSEPQAYYVRGLIEGYMGEYTQSAADYQMFLQSQPNNWAAKNDETWVLLKAGEYKQALAVANSGLANAPSNAWLLNSKATALYELGDYQQALVAAQGASTAVAYLTPAQWSVAYPGNDPAIAGEGLDTFKAAVADNMHTIELAISNSTVQSN